MKIFLQKRMAKKERNLGNGKGMAQKRHGLEIYFSTNSKDLPKIAIEEVLGSKLEQGFRWGSCRFYTVFENLSREYSKFLKKIKKKYL